MIMPAKPKVGDVFRPENICGVVLEEVTVKAADVTVDVTTLEIVRNRFAHTLNDSTRAEVDAILRELRTAADAARLPTAATAAARLRTAVAVKT